RSSTTRRLALRLPAHAKRRPSRAALSVLSQTALRTPRQQLLSPPARPRSPASQQTRSRLPPRRQSHSARSRPPRRLIFPGSFPRSFPRSFPEFLDSSGQRFSALVFRNENSLY